jgi:hypothetical protein
MDHTDIKEHLMRRALIPIILTLGLLTACSPGGIGTDQARLFATAQAPLPTGYPLATQPKMQAMAHWDSLALKVAENCAKAMAHFDPEGDVRVYVAPVAATPFGRSYREALLTRLVDFGVPISFKASGAAVVETGLEMVTHRRKLARTKSGRLYVAEPGFVQAKGEDGLYAPVPVVSEESGFFDAPAPASEIQVTTALIHNGGYLFRDSSIFYIDGKDRAHYSLNAPTGDVVLKRYSLVNK